MTTTLSAVAGQIGRGTRAELTRVGGARSLLLYGLVPGAVLLPLAITLGVATVAERFASISSSIQVTSVTTTNSVYWVITFTVMIWAVVAAYAQATANAVRLASWPGICIPVDGRAWCRAGSPTAWAPRSAAPRWSPS